MVTALPTLYANMAKSTESTKRNVSQPGNAVRPELASLRKEIDRVDREIVRLLASRAKLAREVGAVKTAAGDAIYDLVREHEVLARVVAYNQGPLSDCSLRSIFREIISGSRALEISLRVAFLGPEYSYSHMAAAQQFGESAELTPVGTIAAVFEEVETGQALHGVVPIENSTDGRVTDTLDMFTRSSVKICGEIPLRIRHCLLSKTPRAQITEVHSKPQALSQCRNWLSKHLSGARLVEVASTSAAAKTASETPGVAAIASQQAGKHYGLELAAAGIEDNPNNVTRFAVLGGKSSRKTGDDKSAILFQVEHRPGALADAVTVFKRCMLNLTWIESFPLPAAQGPQYVFFAEVEGHEHDSKFKRAVASLSKKCVLLEVLGSYPKGKLED